MRSSRGWSPPAPLAIVDTLFGSIAPSKQVAYFKPGKELKEQINGDPAQPVLPPMSE